MFGFVGPLFIWASSILGTAVTADQMLNDGKIMAATNDVVKGKEGAKQRLLAETASATLAAVQKTAEGAGIAYDYVASGELTKNVDEVRTYLTGGGAKKDMEGLEKEAKTLTAAYNKDGVKGVGTQLVTAVTGSKPPEGKNPLLHLASAATGGDAPVAPPAAPPAAAPPTPVSPRAEEFRRKAEPPAKEEKGWMDWLMEMTGISKPSAGDAANAILPALVTGILGKASGSGNMTAIGLAIAATLLWQFWLKDMFMDPEPGAPESVPT